MKNNGRLINEQSHSNIKSEIEKGKYDPRTRQWITPPKESEVEHGPNVFHIGKQDN